MWCWGWRWGISKKVNRMFIAIFIFGGLPTAWLRDKLSCAFFLHYFCSVPVLIHLQEKINNLIQIDQLEREQCCSPPYAQDITVYPEKKKKKKFHYFYLSCQYWQHLEVKRQMWADWIFNLRGMLSSNFQEPPTFNHFFFPSAEQKIFI